MSAPATATLRATRAGDVLTVTLARPEARNAINLAMCEELVHLFTALRSDAELRLVVIRGEGPAFCAGVDMHEVKAHSGSADWYVARRHRGLDAYLAIGSCAAPVIAAVHGGVVGGGCEIAAAADFIVAADDASFRYPEALYGAVGATQRLPRRVGAAMAKELLFTGRPVSAAEALALGLVNRVAPAAKLDHAIAELTAAIERMDRDAVRAIKQAIDRGTALDLAAAVDIERELIAAGATGDGWRQGAAAFGASIGAGRVRD